MSFRDNDQRSIKPQLSVSAAGAAAALCAALILMFGLWGFTVDDAWISARVAANLAHGAGYRFNAPGPIVDAVTPFGWAHLLSIAAAGGPLPALNAARWLGALSWAGAAAWLGWGWARLGRRACWAGALSLALTVPLGAWSVSGMETGLVIALATLALGSGWSARFSAGLAAAWRPELLVWSVVLCAVRGFGASREVRVELRVRNALLHALPALVPFLVVAVLRHHMFGAAYPLAWLAKPPHTASGLRYAWGCLLFAGPFWQLLAWRAYRSLSVLAWACLSAGVAHLLVLIAVGGDWMPLYRLVTPVLPGLVHVAAELGARSSGRSWILRSVAQLAAASLLLRYLGPSARGVWEQRLELIHAARPHLTTIRSIASLDIGWLGAATSAEIIDMAGVTDPGVARLAGGHTSKRLPDGWLEQRRVEALLLLANSPNFRDFPRLDYVRQAEARVVQLAGAEHFRGVASFPLKGTTQAYVLALRVPP